MSVKKYIAAALGLAIVVNICLSWYVLFKIVDKDNVAVDPDLFWGVEGEEAPWGGGRSEEGQQPEENTAKGTVGSREEIAAELRPVESLREYDGDWDRAEEAPSEQLNLLLVGLGDDGLRIEQLAVVTINAPLQEASYYPVDVDIPVLLPGDSRINLGSAACLYLDGSRDEAHRELLQEHVGLLTGVRPYYYLEISRSGLANVINSVGSITFEGRRYDAFTFIALMDERLAHEPHVERRVEYIKEAFSEIRESLGFFQYISLASAVLRNVETNISMHELISLYQGLR